MPPGDSRPLRSDAVRNRRRILDASRELFAERGLEASFDEIARRAGVGVGTVYRRFPDRDDLIDALFAERLDALAGHAVEALAHDDPWEGLRWLLERLVAEQALDRGFKEAIGAGARGSQRLEIARGRMAPAFDAVIDRVAGAGLLRPGVGAVDLVLLGGVLAQIATEAQPELWRRYLAALLDGLSSTHREPLPERVPTDDELQEVRQRGSRDIGSAARLTPSSPSSS